MAQDGFILSDEGRTITVVNDSATTAIDAGDLCFAESGAGIDDVLTGTAASARNAYAGSDIKVKSMLCSATGYLTVVGVATEDIPAAGTGSMAMEGVFIHAAKEDIEAGACVQGDEAASNKLMALDSESTAEVVVQSKIGKTLTGGSADGKFIIWKLAL